LRVFNVKEKEGVLTCFEKERMKNGGEDEGEEVMTRFFTPLTHAHFSNPSPTVFFFFISY
jgi:hypothetical protein